MGRRRHEDTIKLEENSLKLYPIPHPGRNYCIATQGLCCILIHLDTRIQLDLHTLFFAKLFGLDIQRDGFLNSKMLLAPLTSS